MPPPAIGISTTPESGRTPLQAAARWQANLELRFAARGSQTRLVLNRHAGPLRLLKALRSEDGRRLEAVIVHPPGGLVGGDSLSIDVDVQAGACVLATTPGAQKWYRGESPATASTRLVVADGARLEWLPQPSILFDRAQARQALAIELEPAACCVGWEILVRGRGAMGERFRSGHVDQVLAISVAGELLWQERLHADAADRLFDSALGWDRRRIAASVWCCAPAAEPGELQALRDRWRALLEPAQSVPLGPPQAMPPLLQADGATAGHRTTTAIGGATLAADGLLLAKLLADDSEELIASCRELWRAARISLEGQAGSTPRIWRT